MLTVEARAEDSIGKPVPSKVSMGDININTPENDKVLHHFLAKVVVNSVDLRLLEEG